MEQNTNALALTQLRPLENNNIGAIVEEHNRYWRKYKDDEEAKKQIAKANEEKFKADKADKADKATSTMLTGLALDDSKGYFRDQIIQSFEKDRPYMANLAMVSNSDSPYKYEAKLKYDQKLAEYKELVSLDKVYQEQAINLEGQEEKLYNEALDFGLKEKFNNISKSNYIVRDGKLGIPNENGEIDYTSASALKADMVFNSKYSGRYDWNDIGGKIADNIKPYDNNGNINITPAVRRDGITKSANALKSDPKALKSYAYLQGYSREKLNDISDVEINKLAEKLFDQDVYRAIQQKSNSIANASTLATTAKTRQNLEKDKPQTVEINFSNATTVIPIPKKKNADGSIREMTSEEIEDYKKANPKYATEPVVVAGTKLPAGTKGIPIAGKPIDMGGGRKVTATGGYVTLSGDVYVRAVESGYASISEKDGTSTITQKPDDEYLIKVDGNANKAYQLINKSLNFDTNADFEETMRTGLGIEKKQAPKAKTQTKKIKFN